MGDDLFTFAESLFDVTASIATACLSICLSIIVFGIIFGLVESYFSNRRYKRFLKEHEGLEFFCYTNRKNSEQFVEEEILPALDSGINIIHLVGKRPVSEYDERCISHMLYRIKQVGFPNIMKIKDGHVVDLSLHNELYNTINQRKDPEVFLTALNGKLNELRTLDYVRPEHWLTSRWLQFRKRA
jgi:hypothetical protein